MLLNNYYNLKKAYASSYINGTNQGKLVSSGTELSVITSNGSSYGINAAICGAYLHADKLRGQFHGNIPDVSAIYTTVPAYNSDIQPSYTYITFGSGSTPPTPDDYTVETRIANITPTGVRVVSIDNGHRCYITYTNGNSTSITIREVVMFGNLSGSAAPHVALLREVFDTPIEVEAGESFIFSWDYVSGE